MAATLMTIGKEGAEQAKKIITKVPKVVTNVLTNIYDVNWHFFIKVGVWTLILCGVGFILLEAVSWLVAATSNTFGATGGLTCTLTNLLWGTCAEPLDPTLIMYDLKYILLSGAFFGLSLITLTFLYTLITYLLNKTFNWDNEMNRISNLMFKSGDEFLSTKEETIRVERGEVK